MKIYRSLGELQRYVDSGGMMRRTFYVDVENGDDNNDGSSSAPFRTIKKACDSVPIGGYGDINLIGGQELFIDNDIIIQNKAITIIGDSSNYPTITFKTFVADNFNVTYYIGTYKSTLKIKYCILQHEPKINTNSSWTVFGGGRACLAIAYDSYGHGNLILGECKINQTRDFFISSKHSLANIAISNCDINFSEDVNALIITQFGTLSLSVWNNTITSGYKWADGTIGQNIITNLSSLNT